MTCHHGVEWFCRHCHDENEARTKERIKAGTARYAIFVWSEDIRFYVYKNAALDGRRFKSRTAAQRFIEAQELNSLPDRGYVVRLVSIEE